MKLSRRRVLHLAAGAAVLPALSRIVWAQVYPSRPVRFLVPFPAGGPSDVLARLYGQKLSQRWKQPVVVENRVGATGTIGTEAVVRAPPDGYTLLFTADLPITMAPALLKLRYDPQRDLAPVAALAKNDLLVVVHPSTGIRSLADLIAAAKAKPGALTFASAGVGSATHWAAERFIVSAGFKATHVPFRGGPEALTEVMTGRVDFIFIGISSGLPFIQNKQLVPLAVSSAKRSPTLPDIPTTLEAGYKDSDFNYWNGMLVPAKTPGPVIERLYAETTKALALPEVQQKLAVQGVEPAPLSPSEMDAMIRREIALNLKIAKEAGLKFN